MQPCVIFDLDGTLADTSLDLLAAANRCFEEMGEDVRLSIDSDRMVALRGGRMMLGTGLKRAGRFDEARVMDWYPRLLEVYAETLDVHTQMYPGAVASVEQLKEAGYAVGICTNKPEGLAHTLLTRLGVRDLFGSLIGADTLPVKKPDPAHFWAAVDGCGGQREASLLVGDSDTDRKTSAAARVPSVLVAFSPAGEAVRDLAPESVITHFDQLHGEVARLIGHP
ncbi:HAD hydrolase-like protein [Primorskyibacter sp. 2E107]|uniref:HAD hydrolase-like protein n=1 Tax=Primorskyibacter sp. 2E107 TaxID=3403458 RepID=UPI003AF98EA6